ncbi:MAG: tetratricopeptide repeat protein [Alphaproteobacteria bacterium]|nr:tetratricopeptide repeat protein [Alphaproteobacteria bacterium]
MATKSEYLAGRANEDVPAPDESAFDQTLVSILSKAIEVHKSGDLTAAEDGYHRALDMVPDHPHALHFMGVLQHQKGNSTEAITLISRAIEGLPDFADAYSNLGAAYHAMENLPEAEASFRRAAELKSDLPEAHSNLAAVLIEQGKREEAIEAYKLAHEIAPTEPKFVKRLGDLFIEIEDFTAAINWFTKFLVVVEDEDGEVSNNLGYAFERMGKLEESAEWYRKAATLCPTSPEINNNLGSVLGRLGHHEEADAYFNLALEIDPEKWEDLSNLAGTYVNRREVDRALPIYDQLIAKQPDNAKLYNDYAVALSVAGQLSNAEQAFEKAIEIDPEFSEAFNNLGSNLLNQGRRIEAIDHFKKAIQFAPTYIEPHINICLALANEQRLEEAYVYAQATTLNSAYRPEMFSNPHKVFRAVCDFDAMEALGDPWENVEQTNAADYSANFLAMLVLADTEEKTTRLTGLHRKWGEDLKYRVMGEPLPPVSLPSKNKKIRLGIMSSDLRHHSVAKFVLPILENYDHEKFEIFCYAPMEARDDKVQAQIKELVSEFRIMSNHSDLEIAEVIRADEIDILFELNGFTRDTKLKVLAFKPAPIQIYWLGYPFTTGIGEIDYIILDPHVAPTNPDWMVEKPLLMPECWVCFGSFDEEPISERPPMERNGFVTFGTLNNPYKLTRETIALWCQVMNKVPNSRFLYVRPEADSLALCQNLTQEFGKHGIGPERLFLVNNRKTGLSHLSYYDEIDISLDTFPLTGGTTTCDTLWMGVPVVTKVGPSMHQRLSYSHLTNAGLQELCVETDDDYVKTAVGLAEDPDALAFLRSELRGALRESALCRSEDFARHFQDLMLGLVEQHGLR